MILKNINNILNWGINLFLISFILIALWLFCQVFLFASFRIPSDSMEPELIEGDAILIWKPTLGARLFNLQAAMQIKQVDIHRIPGFRKVKRNDVLVFNFPHPNGWDKIGMHILKYYIKRCVGLPGDTLSIQQGIFKVNKINTPLGNIESEEKIGQTIPEDFPKGVYHSYPFDPTFNWNIQNFGPLYIPKAGDQLPMNRNNYLLYHKLIAWEQKTKIEYKDSIVFLNDKQIEDYCFQKNYYFMAGDKGMNSQDSRYWGLLPEEYIVGKATLVWKSVNPYNKEIRWDRLFKIIH